MVAVWGLHVPLLAWVNVALMLNPLCASPARGPSDYCKLYWYWKHNTTFPPSVGVNPSGSPRGHGTPLSLHLIPIPPRIPPPPPPLALAGILLRYVEPRKKEIRGAVMR